MVVRPPLEILLVIGIVDRVVELFVDLWQTRILGNVQAFVYGEQHVLEEAQPGLLHLLALPEHVRHALDVHGVVFFDLAERLFVPVATLRHIVLKLLYPFLHLFQLQANKKKVSTCPMSSIPQCSFVSVPYLIVRH